MDRFLYRILLRELAPFLCAIGAAACFVYLTLVVHGPSWAEPADVRLRNTVVAFFYAGFLALMLGSLLGGFGWRTLGNSAAANLVLALQAGSLPIAIAALGLSSGLTGIFEQGCGPSVCQDFSAAQDAALLLVALIPLVWWLCVPVISTLTLLSTQSSSGKVVRA
jgi:hypothetical protein